MKIRKMLVNFKSRVLNGGLCSYISDFTYAFGAVKCNVMQCNEMVISLLSYKHLLRCNFD